MLHDFDLNLDELVFDLDHDGDLLDEINLAHTVSPADPVEMLRLVIENES